MAEMMPKENLHVIGHPDKQFVSIVNTRGIQILAIVNKYNLIPQDVLMEMGAACAEIIKARPPRLDLGIKLDTEKPNV